MVETSAGKKLSAARVNQGLSLEEAAHAVKMRPDKLHALEHDDYGRFGSPAYAKGFLMIYSRFLGVDVSDQLRDFDGLDTRVNIEEYQYLNNVPEPKPDPRLPVRRYERERAPSILPLLGFVAVCVLAAVGYYIMVGVQRLGLDKSATAAVATPAASAETAPEVEPVAKASPAPRRRTVEEKLPTAAVAAVIPNVLPTQPVATDAPDAPPAASLVEEFLVIEPVRTSLVKIRKDSPDSPPIFEGYLYKSRGPLKKKGTKSTKFFVEVADQSAVKISKGGRPFMAYHPDIAIQ